MYCFPTFAYSKYLPQVAAQFHLSSKLVDGELHLESDNVDDLYRFASCAWTYACVLGTWMTQYTELAGYKMVDLSLKMSENAVTLERKRFREICKLKTLGY